MDALARSLRATVREAVDRASRFAFKASVRAVAQRRYVGRRWPPPSSPSRCAPGATQRRAATDAYRAKDRICLHSQIARSCGRAALGAARAGCALADTLAQPAAVTLESSGRQSRTRGSCCRSASEHSGSILTTSQPDKFFRSALKASDPSSPRFSVGAALSNYAEEQQEEDERVATVMRELESQAKVRAVDRERQRAKAAVLAVQGAGSPPREAVMRLRNLGSALARDSAIYKMPS